MEKNKLCPHPTIDSYFATRDGDVYSGKTNKMLKPSTNSRGYKHVILRVEGKSKYYLVHRFVSECFMGMSDLTVNHINSNKLDNNIENLEYCSRKENAKHYFEKGPGSITRGSKHWASKYSDFQISTVVRRLGEKVPHKMISLESGVSRHTIYNIAEGRTNRHLFCKEVLG